MSFCQEYLLFEYEEYNIYMLLDMSLCTIIDLDTQIIIGTKLYFRLRQRRLYCCFINITTKVAEIEKYNPAYLLRNFAVYFKTILILYMVYTIYT